MGDGSLIYLGVLMTGRWTKLAVFLLKIQAKRVSREKEEDRMVWLFSWRETFSVKFLYSILGFGDPILSLLGIWRSCKVAFFFFFCLGSLMGEDP